MPPTISSLMTQDHRACDIKFEDIEKRIHNNDFDQALTFFHKWKAINLRHFEFEESVLFPETTMAMGTKIPPIMIMEMEHIQIKKQIFDLEASIEAKNPTLFSALADTCMTMIQQHNMKEEQILYPLIERSVTGRQNITEAIGKFFGTRASDDQ